MEQAPPTTSSFDKPSEGSSESAEERWDWLLSDNELSVDMLDGTVMSGCTCGALRAHTKTCNEPQGTLPCTFPQPSRGPHLLARYSQEGQAHSLSGDTVLSQACSKPLQTRLMNCVLVIPSRLDRVFL